MPLARETPQSPDSQSAASQSPRANQHVSAIRTQHLLINTPHALIQLHVHTDTLMRFTQNKTAVIDQACALPVNQSGLVSNNRF